MPAPKIAGFFFVLYLPDNPRFFCIMENQETIPGKEALRRARNLKYVPGAAFTLIHLTCNFKTGQGGETVKHERCRVRPALKEDTFQLDGDLYFTYEDLDTGEPKMCFKSLIRFIGFPPDYKLLKVDWFND
jgi:hypothetical protein